MQLLSRDYFFLSPLRVKKVKSYNYLEIQHNPIELWRVLFEESDELFLGEGGEIPLHSLLHHLRLSNLRSSKTWESQ